MPEIILQALEARIVGLKKVVRLRWLLVAGWVRGCARLMLVHMGILSWAGSRGVASTCGAISLSNALIIAVSLLFTTSFVEVYPKFRYDAGRTRKHD